MPDKAPEKSDNKALVIALIGAFATVVAALIGLIPVYLLSQQNKEEAKATREKEKAKDEEPRRFSGRDKGGLDLPDGGKRGKERPNLRPPLSISKWENALPTRGLVMVLTNESTRDIKNVRVFVSAKGDAGERVYTVGPVTTKAPLKVGWVELGKTPLKAGDRVRIEVEGYSDDVEAVVPKKASTEPRP